MGITADWSNRRVSELGDRPIEIVQCEDKKKRWIKWIKNEQRLIDTWDNIKMSNIHLIRVPEEEIENSKMIIIMWRYNDWKFTKLGERHTFTD